MKKKGPRAIPDFSRKPRKLSTPSVADPKGQPTPHPATVVHKPQGAPLKPGRRGT